MVGDRSVVEQAHEIQLLVRKLVHFDCIMSDKFVVGGIIAKLPPSWRGVAMVLKHKEDMTVESLIITLKVEEKARSKDVPHSGLMDSGLLMQMWWKANLVGETKIRTGNQGPSRTLILRRRRKTLQT
jgi:hypothetical protein